MKETVSESHMKTIENGEKRQAENRERIKKKKEKRCLFFEDARENNGIQSLSIHSLHQLLLNTGLKRFEIYTRYLFCRSELAIVTIG